ncbi:unnamed protein product [Rotaria sordida]|uniref:DUF4371 domain-containing protein n=1 Tax=Rotaria sordida TaxID=392033 RepID=A0A819KG98_9BILA|nr:unnamed protein product [Rotaria sordida]CAF3949026.1 unnamed protein product [Rotaria sordida]
MYEISGQTAPTIVEAILDALIRCGLGIINCPGQSYDGASNMFGVYGDVSALILNRQSKDVYVHCNTHCSDLHIQDLTYQCATIRNSISYVKHIIDFIRRAPKHLAILTEISTQIFLSYTNLTALCPT